MRKEIERERLAGLDAGCEGVEGMSIEEMSWSDRERVLKILLSRIDRKQKTQPRPLPDKLMGEASREGPTQPT